MGTPLRAVQLVQLSLFGNAWAEAKSDSWYSSPGGEGRANVVTVSQALVSHISSKPRPSSGSTSHPAAAAPLRIFPWCSPPRTSPLRRSNRKRNILGAFKGAILFLRRTSGSACSTQESCFRSLRRNGAGLVVDPVDQPAFIKAALQLLNDETLRANAAAKARSFALDNYDIKTVTDRFETVSDYAIGAKTAERKI